MLTIQPGSFHDDDHFSAGFTGFHDAVRFADLLEGEDAFRARFESAGRFKLNVGYLGVGITNGAVDFLTRWLAVELAPIRVNAISPGVIDTGAWDSLGAESKRDYFERIAAGNPARRIGTPDDVAGGVLFAMTNTFFTGMTLKVDGGEPLV